MRSAAITVFCSLLLFVTLSAPALAQVIYIKPDGTGDFPTIQDGINAAFDNQLILLAAGTYTGDGNRDISFMGKAITVTSESGKDATIIDCEGLGRGFIFQNGEGPGSRLSDVTIQNGSTGDCGGGIYCWNSSPIIDNNTITQNFASEGGGIGCHNSSPEIAYNAINYNQASSLGGGIYCASIDGGECSPGITNNNIWNNTASTVGGGIGCLNSCPFISTNVLASNYAEYGGGMFFERTEGGFCDAGSYYNTIIENSAVWGGGIGCQDASPAISNNTISGNSASSGGGGIWMLRSYSTLDYNIIAFSNDGEGLYCQGGNPTIAACDIFANAGGDALCGHDGGYNISADPLFCLTGTGFYLSSNSPCAPGNHPSGQVMLIGAWPVGCSGPVSVETTTWGAIKQKYSDD